VSLLDCQTQLPAAGREPLHDEVSGREIYTAVLEHRVRTPDDFGRRPAGR